MYAPLRPEHHTTGAEVFNIASSFSKNVPLLARFSPKKTLRSTKLLILHQLKLSLLLGVLPSSTVFLLLFLLLFLFLFLVSRAFPLLHPSFYIERAAISASI